MREPKKYSGKGMNNTPWWVLITMAIILIIVGIHILLHEFG
jgi:uncharacterized membrane protein HdeD (DUF308 family)